MKSHFIRFSCTLTLNCSGLLALALLALGMSAIQAQDEGSGIPAEVPWRYGIKNQPAVLLHTDRYVYESGEDNDNRYIHGIIDPAGYEEEVTFFLWWMDRKTGEKRFFNYEDGLSKNPVDLFGEDGELEPVKLEKRFSNILLAADKSGDMRMPRDLPTEPGPYMWCFELRTPDGRQLVSRAYAQYAWVTDVVKISGTLKDDQTWTPDYAYLLTDRVIVPDGVTLTLDPGCFVFGSTEQMSLLNVEIGGRLVADGTEMMPIVFTSELPLFKRSRSDWGGIIINGDAPVNEPNAKGEGDTGNYGGDNAKHNGGILRYVRVEFSGRRFSETDELNGLTFQGVGNGTIVENVQVHQCSDDGIEFFGGTVNARNILVSGCGDDCLDWTFGYAGKLQNLVLMQLYSDAHRGIEADNHPKYFDVEPRSNPTIYNATFLGLARMNPQRADVAEAILLRRGAYGQIHNSIFMGFGGRPIAIESDQTKASLASGQSNISHNVFADNNLLAEELFAGEGHNHFDRESYPEFTSLNWIKPNLTPMPDNFASQEANIKLPPVDGFFKPEKYIGGIDPNGEGEPWVFQPWTNYVLR